MLLEAGISAGVISAEACAPIVSAVTNNISTLLPVGVGILGAMIGVGLIPRIIYKFL